MVLLSAVVGLALLHGVVAQSGAYGQCGGIGWAGATTCVSGWTCTYSNPYYSQCLPGAAPTTSSPTTSKSSTSVGGTTSKPTSPTTTVTTTTSSKPPGTTTVAAGSPGTTLLPNWYWIRAVEAPNFHHYLQSSPQQATGVAILGDYTTAGQFNIINGQLVQIINGGAYLYGVVEKATNTSVKLELSWSKSSADTTGTFAFQGDAVTWTIPGITRSNTAAWLVCDNLSAWINLGPYAYNTPPGCVDETIHYYNGATAVN